MTRKAPTKEQRKLVYQMYDGHCAYCGCELELKDMQVDHFNSVYAYDGKDELENYMPSCRQCNFYKRACTVEQFRQNLKETMLVGLKKTFLIDNIFLLNILSVLIVDIKKFLSSLVKIEFSFIINIAP